MNRVSHASVVWLKITSAGFGVYLMSAIRDMGFEIDWGIPGACRVVYCTFLLSKHTHTFTHTLVSH